MAFDVVLFAKSVARIVKIDTFYMDRDVVFFGKSVDPIVKIDVLNGF